MTERIMRMKERLNTTTFPLCIDRMRVAFPVLEALRGQHIFKIRSSVHEAILTKCPVVIEPDDLICGVGSSKPFGIEMDYEHGQWTPDEIASLKAENYTIDPDEEAALYDYMERYKVGDLGTTSFSAIGEILTDNPEIWAFMKSGVLLPPWKSKVRGAGGGRAASGMGLSPLGLFVADFDTFLNVGCREIINICKDKLNNHTYFTPDSLDKKMFWQAVIRVYEAIIVWANRYADLALQMADEEKDLVRAKELREMAEICRRVPEFPARNFREALQSFWFAFLLSTPSNTASAGRFDQYMYPFYKKDKDAGLITDEQVLELLEIIRLKDFQLNTVTGKVSRQKNSGMAKWHNFTLGGQDREGNDVANELTYLLFEAAKEVQIPHHTLTLRVNENTSIETIVKGLEVVKTGLGMPAFVGDKSYINFFVNKGLTVEDSRNYCMVGCVDAVVPRLTRNYLTAMFSMPLVYDIFMHNGFCGFTNEMVGLRTGEVTEFETFEEYKEGFYTQLRYFIGRAIQQMNVWALIERDKLPDFFKSVQIEGCLETGTEYLRINQKPYDALIILSAVGVINVADSMAVIKKLVYDEKKYTMEELMSALDANWVGYEDMRRDCIAVPKYGNDDSLPDDLAAEIYARYAEILNSFDTPCGGKAVANAISISAHQPAGAATGATPDGRFKGEICADASMSPGQGRDKNGPLAAFRSAMKINQDDYQATLMNMKFHPNALATDEDLRKLASVIKTYLTNGGKHIQFNVVSRETLEDAQKKPYEYRDLVVRVAGYSAYFTALTTAVQNEIIDRTTNVKL